MIIIVKSKTMKLRKVWLITSCWLLTTLRATTDAQKNAIDHMDRLLKKKRKVLLGECEGNCSKNEDCAYGMLCSRRNKRALKEKGYDPRLAFCPDTYSKGGYVCYNSWDAHSPKCPLGLESGDSCSDPNHIGYFNGSNMCINGTVSDSCCRPRKKIINSTASICRPYQVCNTGYFCECLSDYEQIECFNGDAICEFEPRCIN